MRLKRGYAWDYMLLHVSTIYVGNYEMDTLSILIAFMLISYDRTMYVAELLCEWTCINNKLNI